MAASHRVSVPYETLVRHIAEGNASALGALYRRYGNRLFGLLPRHAVIG